MSFPLSTAERGADVLAGLLREALDRVFTSELPRTARSQVIGEPRISLVQQPHSNRYYVTVQFEMEHRQL